MGLLEEATSELPAGAGRGLSLVALGGYGRAQLCPGSDIDVVLLHPGRTPRPELERLAQRLWYPLWDAGLALGHAVLTVKQALSLATGDLSTATSLLDARVVAGDEEQAADLRERAHAQWRAKAARWLEALESAVELRHSRSGEVAFLLEPDVKEGRGGLRDVHALGWAKAARPILVDTDDEALTQAHEALLQVRVELHRRTGKASDRLTLQEQDGLAADLGQPDADALMAAVAGAARTIAWNSDETWDRISSWRRGPSGRVAGGDHPAGTGLVLREGVVELAPGADPSLDPGLVLRAAASAASHRTRLGRHTLDRLAAHSPPLGERWPDGALQDLVRLLAAGPAAIPVLEALDQKGLLVRVLPEWEPVRSRHQRNAYHRYTVDRHLCEAAARAAALAPRVHRPDLLLVGTWLHDIGKGFTDGGSGDHSQAGAAVVARVAPRMGFPPSDAGVLVTLVRHHLLLADMATRRDLEEESTVAAVAEAVRDETTLELLHALTEADSVATGPAAWSTWKADLVAELVSRTSRQLAGEETGALEFPSPWHRRVAERARAGDGVAVEVHHSSLTVVAPDARGLFSRVAGVLSLHGLDVLAARAASEDGAAIEEFRVEPLAGRRPDWEAVEADLRRAVAGRLALEARLAERARDYAAWSSPAAARPARTLVEVVDDASEAATVVEVRAPDRVGTLYRITRALVEMGLDIRHAKVATLGHEVVDTFYVTDGNGDKLDGALAAELRRAVLFELSR